MKLHSIYRIEFYEVGYTTIECDSRDVAIMIASKYVNMFVTRNLLTISFDKRKKIYVHKEKIVSKFTTNLF